MTDDDRLTIWEAFGCAPDCHPITRIPSPHVRPVTRAGATVRYHRHELDALDDPTGVTAAFITLPAGEVIRTYGDDTRGAYVHIYATSAEQAEAMYRRIEAHLPAFLEHIWSTT